MESTDNNINWYALRVRPRFEKAVSRNLQSKGYEEFLPVYTRRSRWSDRVKEIELPLFSGYVFCRFNLLHRLPILVIPGVNAIVGFGKNPVPIDDREIRDLRAVVKSGAHCEPWPFPEPGQKVRVECGPLAGTEGTVLMVKNTYRIVISVNLLQRSVAVEIDRDALKLVPRTSQQPLQKDGSRPELLVIG